MVLSGEAEESIPIVAEVLGAESGWLLCDYQQDPRSRSEIESVKESLAGTGFRTRVFPSVSTILDIESVLASRGYRDPKSSSDIAALLRESLGEDRGSYAVPSPLDPPSVLKFDSGIFERLRVSEALSRLIVDMDEISERSEGLGTGDAYFRGGESEALERLSRKVSDRPEFVNEFSKPSTISTNEQDNPMEPSTTGLSPYLSTGCLSVRKVWYECAKANLTSEHTEPPQSLIGQLMFREMFYLLSRSVENWDDDVGNSNCKPIEWGSTTRSWSVLGSGDDRVPLHRCDDAAVGGYRLDAPLGKARRLVLPDPRSALAELEARQGRFREKLVDSDWALNNGNWLWLAGVAPFSMPYYRVYNPCPDAKSSLNVEAKEASFIRHWVPEARLLPLAVHLRAAPRTHRGTGVR